MHALQQFEIHNFLPDNRKGKEKQKVMDNITLSKIIEIEPVIQGIIVK